jgi:hypothetical protein
MARSIPTRSFRCLTAKKWNWKFAARNNQPNFLYNRLVSECGLPPGKAGGNLTNSSSESENEFQGETSLWHSEW